MRPGVVEQVREAFAPGARLAAALGALVGGLVPVAAFTVAHGEVMPPSSFGGGWGGSLAFVLQIPVAIVLGCLLFSATSVYQWGKLAFGQTAKALGFVVLTEAILICSRTPWLTWVVLVYLVAINAIATACVIARGGK